MILPRTSSSLVNTVREYADLYFDNLDVYLGKLTGRKQHYEYLRRIKRCGGDQAAIRAVLGLEG